MTITNLPLLFANGHPKSLDKMTIEELECFIPFMVHCSLGHDTAKNIQRPNWWPADVTFSDPLMRPKPQPNDWGERLRGLVKLCYKSHCSEFLLKFCEDLAKHERSTLLLVSNCDGTTSLYLRASQRLLVTFRNENMLYDRKVTPMHRKSLLPQRQLTGNSIVESEKVDIYLCDTCDDVFESLTEIQNHEKICTQQTSTSITLSPRAENLSPEPESLESSDQRGFLHALGLKDDLSELSKPSPPKFEPKAHTHTGSIRQRRTVTFNGRVRFPFSSPAGLRYSKIRHQTSAFLGQREHLDRYCAAPVGPLDMRWIRKYQYKHFPVRYKKTENYWSRMQVFPNQRGKMILDIDSQLQFLKCKSCEVRLKPITEEEIKSYTTKPNNWTSLYNTENSLDVKLHNTDNDDDIEFVSCSTFPSSQRCEVLGKRRPVKKRVTPHISPKEKLARPKTCFVEIDIPFDVIDLCSDDDENENVYPSDTLLSTSDIVTQNFVLTSASDCLQPLDANSELERTQLQVNLSSAQINKNQYLTVRDSEHNKLRPLKQCYDNVYSSHLNNVIPID